MGRRGRGPTILGVKSTLREIPVNEDWHPTIDGKITLCLHEWPHDRRSKVSVWGGDDYCMAIWLPEGHGEEARHLFESIPDYVTQAQLRSFGLIDNE